jgi:S1-C subfamily serine protease
MNARVFLLSLVCLGFALPSACSNRNTPSPATSAEPQPVEAVAPAKPSAPPPVLVDVPPVTPPSPGFRTEDERNSVQVFRAVAQSTVFVTQTRVVVDYWAGTAAEVPAGSGSGFIWNQDGYIVTNFHVIKGARNLTVTLHDHRNFEAEVVGAEPRKDIAVLKLRNAPANLVPIHVREKHVPLEVGQKTIAIGNPFGLDHTLTTGVVSALGREVQGIGGVTIRDMVQTDAAINPGNSGGPLLDSSGSLIGMNTMIYSQSGSSAGIGFAVPATAIQRVVPQIISTGRAESVGLGVHIDPSQRLEQRLNLKGVIVLQVVAGGPAEKAGLRGVSRSGNGISLGDVIVGVNDTAIEDYDDLYNTLDRFKAGDRVTLAVRRDEGVAKLSLDLIALP